MCELRPNFCPWSPEPASPAAMVLMSSCGPLLTTSRCSGGVLEVHSSVFLFILIFLIHFSYLEVEGKKHSSTLFLILNILSVQFSCSVVSDSASTPGLPVHHQLPEFTQTHVHWVSDAIQPSHPLSSPCPPAPNPSQHQGLFQWVNSLHEVPKVLEFQL